MRLYSIQPVFIYEALARGEPFCSRPRADPQSWLNDQEGEKGPNIALAAYEWLCAQMCRRGMERPAPDVFPLWAYQQWAGPAKPKPDLRYGCMKSWGGGNERHVLLTLEIPQEKVLLSDYDAWHSVLNYWFLGRSSECSAFERLCKSHGLSYYRSKPLPDDELHQRLVESWQQIFDLQRMPRVMGYKKADQVVQATFWQLEPSQVLEALEFGAGRPSRKLALP